LIKLTPEIYAHRQSTGDLRTRVLSLGVFCHGRLPWEFIVLGYAVTLS